MGCLGSLFAILLIVAVIYLIISHIKQILMVILICTFFLVGLSIIIEVCKYGNRKIIKTLSGKPTFMRKILDVLNMDNWGKKEIELPPLESETEEKSGIPESANDSKDGTETSVAEDEILESLKKQYYIVEEKNQEDNTEEKSETGSISDRDDLAVENTEEVENSDDLKNLEQTEQVQIELSEKWIEEKEKEFASSIENEDDVKEEPRPVKRKPKPRYTYMSQYEIEKYARECNAYVEREERKEQYEQRNAKNEESCEKDESTQTKYEYVLFSESINTDSIIGFRSDYMRSDYTIEPIFYESHQYLYNVWKLSNDLKKAIKAKKFFESLEEIERALETIDKYNYPKFNPEKEKEYFYSKKDEVLISFLNRSFTDEYRSCLELKTSKGKINRLGNWFSVIDYYKKDFNPNVLEAFECLVDKWQFEILPSILEPENKKEI